jgi:hypothetical protein
VQIKKGVDSQLIWLEKNKQRNVPRPEKNAFEKFFFFHFFP